MRHLFSAAFRFCTYLDTEIGLPFSTFIVMDLMIVILFVSETFKFKHRLLQFPYFRPHVLPNHN